MLKIVFLLGVALLCTAQSFAAPVAQLEREATTVFTAGANGFPAVRIPSIVCTRSGTLVAFAEGRRNLSDQAQNKIIARRSSNGGKTWSSLQIVADDGARPLNNPCAVVDEKTGLILLMFQSYPQNLKEASGGLKTGYEGDDIVKSYLVHSDDEGRTWSQMEDLTRQVKRSTGATTIASGPGIGVQLQRGPHAGRLVMPFNEGPYGRWNIYTVFSDDGGQSWQCGENVPGGTGQVNECQVAEVGEGRLYFNSRSGSGPKVRRTSFSGDGGKTWSPVQEETALIDPRCMGSVLAVGGGARSRLVFSAPHSVDGREAGTVYLSEDEGKSWPVQKLIEPGMFAYSNLVQLPDGMLGCLYETNGYQSIVFKKFSLEWLTGEVDRFGRKAEAK